MRAAEGPNLLWYGKGEQEVVAGQASLQLCFQPLAAFMILALWTMAVAAGTVDQVFFAAVVALIDSNAVLPGAAVDDSIDGFFVLNRHIRI